MVGIIFLKCAWLSICFNDGIASLVLILYSLANMQFTRQSVYFFHKHLM